MYWKFYHQKMKIFRELAEAVLTSTHNMFLAEIRRIMYTPVNPFYYITVGFKGVKII